jgi:UDP-N-acetylmuramate dehydrogenase
MAPVIAHAVPLAPLTTLELGGPARSFAEARDEDELRSLLLAHRGDRPIVLGGGSNVVIDDEGYDGLVIRMAIAGVRFEDVGAGQVRVRVGAGERWDDLVATTVARGLAGLECLSGIPGSVGATPIQNVGAYGQEIADCCVEVRCIDRTTGEIRRLDAAECGFSYRHSRFKESSLANLVVTEVTFRLVQGGAPKIRYAELTRALAGRSAPPGLAEVRTTVLALRRSKSMVIDPADENRRSAGSFFVNPIVSAAAADEVERRARAKGAVDGGDSMPRFAAGEGQVKLAAGWLIERAGFSKGLRRGHVGISTAHALALVHHGGGTSRELWALADEIIAGVRDAFGVVLRPEPVRITSDGRPGAPL